MCCLSSMVGLCLVGDVLFNIYGWFMSSPAEKRNTIRQIRVTIKDIMMKAKDPDILTAQYVRKLNICIAIISSIVLTDRIVLNANHIFEAQKWIGRGRN